MSAATAPGLAGAATRRAGSRALCHAGLLAIAAATVLALMLTDLGTGPGALTAGQVMGALLDPAGSPPRLVVIVWEIRLPVALLAAVIGAMLGLAGAQMQTILDNPLADPFTLGLSSAAGVGASVAIVTGLSVLPATGPTLVMANAFLFAFGAAMLVHAFTLWRGATSETMILFGIALMFTFNALLALLQYRASETQLVQIVFWMMGSLQRASLGGISVAAGVLAICGLLLWRRRWALTAMRFGDDRAASLGVDPRRLRLEVLLLVALLSATAVSFVGVVGFVGLVGPHVARMLVGEDQRWFAPMATLAGAAMLSATSIVSKTLSPGIIYPIGIITALIGVPFFLSLVLAKRSVAR
ncbi:iron ABC transporter permease [Roseomonas sp. AR75]|uniref:FecCD family ABC transporter permease n=1 Tax=Roseomonas sp. AR75 TaxID=2562311 RepID=UPI001980322B|nr:iron ABC transporter permease [Roseomonas sp. AR75]